MPTGSDSPLAAVLHRAQALGFIGGTDLTNHIDHALGFARAFGSSPPSAAVDLGSGGGLPGLVLARHWPTSAWWLVDANERRSRFLTEAVAELGWQGRVVVVRGRAEEVARRSDLRAAMDLVTARSFGSPAVTAECGAAFLAPDGRLVVSEPPPGSEESPSAPRWPMAGLAELDLEVVPQDSGQDDVGTYQVLRMVGQCPDRYPRRVGIPAKRPLFG